MFLVMSLVSYSEVKRKGDEFKLIACEINLYGLYYMN